MPESPAPTPPTGQPACGLALVAEGSETGNRIVRKVLCSLGIGSVLEALDGAEVLSALGEQRPDLLVLDWEQAVVPGPEIVAFARDAVRSHAPTMPIVVTMSAPTRSAVAAALGEGVSAIVAKPFSVGVLRARLQAVLAGGTPPA